MMSTLYIFTLIFMILMIMLSLNMLLSKNSPINFNKLTPFECGFNPLNSHHPSFSLNFYLMTILFLVFDIEITIILPFIILFKISKMKIIMNIFFLFMYIMLLSLFHEWNQNILNWKI